MPLFLIFSIQIGLSRQIIAEYVEEWVKAIEDLSPRVKKMCELLRAGQAEKAKRLLLTEKVYMVNSNLTLRLLIRR